MKHFSSIFFLCIFSCFTAALADDTDCVRNNCLGTCITRAEALNKMIPMICHADYACYQDVECVKKDDGKCGWAETQQMKNCIADKKKDVAPSLPAR